MLLVKRLMFNVAVYFVSLKYVMTHFGDPKVKNKEEFKTHVKRYSHFKVKRYFIECLGINYCHHFLVVSYDAGTDKVSVVHYTSNGAIFTQNTNLGIGEFKYEKRKFKNFNLFGFENGLYIVPHSPDESKVQNHGENDVNQINGNNKDVDQNSAENKIADQISKENEDVFQTNGHNEDADQNSADKDYVDQIKRNQDAFHKEKETFKREKEEFERGKKIFEREKEEFKKEFEEDKQITEGILSRIGEKEYDIRENNCEHVINSILTGVSTSKESEKSPRKVDCCNSIIGTVKEVGVKSSVIVALIGAIAGSLTRYSYVRLLIAVTLNSHLQIGHFMGKCPHILGQNVIEEAERIILEDDYKKYSPELVNGSSLIITGLLKHLQNSVICHTAENLASDAIIKTGLEALGMALIAEIIFFYILVRSLLPLRGKKVLTRERFQRMIFIRLFAGSFSIIISIGSASLVQYAVDDRPALAFLTVAFSSGLVSRYGLSVLVGLFFDCCQCCRSKKCCYCCETEVNEEKNKNNDDVEEQKEDNNEDEDDDDNGRHSCKCGCCKCYIDECCGQAEDCCDPIKCSYGGWITFLLISGSLVGIIATLYFTLD